MNNDELEKINFSKWPIPDEYLIELGRISALWATLDSFMNVCIGKLAGFDKLNDPQPFILLTHATFPQRINMLGALCEQLALEFHHLNGYKEVVGALNNAQKKRNKFMHNGMVFNNETHAIEMPVGSARGTLKVGIETISIADIRRAVIAIDEANTALYKLVLKREIEPVWKRRASGKET
jgi:hypothetical protein